MEDFLLPRVSEILDIWSRDQLQAIDPKVLENACIRGTEVHAYCTAYAKKLWTEEAPEEYQGYVESFKLWWEENVQELVWAEERLYDKELLFSGKFDMVVRLKGEEHLTLLDLKTSASYQKDWPVKLSAYLHLLNLNQRDVQHALSVRLKKDGKKPCVKDFGDCNPYYRVFLSALSCYDYFIRRKEKKNAES